MFPKLVIMRVLDYVFAILIMYTTASRFKKRLGTKIALGLDDVFALLTLLTYCAMVGVLKLGES